MKLSHILFALVIGMGLIVIAALLLEPAPNASGVTHPTIGKPMEAGGDGETRHEGRVLIGWAFGLLQILFFTALLALGARRGGKLGRFRMPIIIGGIAYVAVWTLLVVAYRAYMLGDNRELYLGFPAPTAFMIYGIWLVPFIFVVLYLLNFDRAYFTAEDAKRFDELLEAKKSRDAEDAA